MKNNVLKVKKIETFSYLNYIGKGGFYFGFVIIWVTLYKSDYNMYEDRKN